MKVNGVKEMYFEIHPPSLSLIQTKSTQQIIFNTLFDEVIILFSAKLAMNLLTYTVYRLPLKKKSARICILPLKNTYYLEKKVLACFQVGPSELHFM